jgi:hypothetical protein
MLAIINYYKNIKALGIYGIWVYKKFKFGMLIAILYQRKIKNDAKKMKKILLISCLLVACLVFWGSGKAEAAIWTLTDVNSTVQVNDSTSVGAYQWQIDGYNNLFQHQYWYRVGSSGGEQPITNLPLISAQMGFNKYLDLKYGNDSLEIRVNYLLTGGAVGSHKSDLAADIAVTNLTGSSMDFHLFKYTDFDIYSNAGFDIGTLMNPMTISQRDQFSGFYDESVMVPQMDLWEIAFRPSLLDKLNDGNPDNLLNQTSPLVAGLGQYVTWAAQWNRTIGPGGSFIMPEDNYITFATPEPGTLILLGSGLLGLWGFRKKFKN